MNGILAMATNATEERFRIVNEFLGFGVLHAPIWFIGIEEAGTWGKHPENDQQQYDKYALRWFPAEKGEFERDARDKGRGYTKIYDIMSKLIVASTNPASHDFEGWKEFRNGKLFQPDGTTFQANVFPLGKSSTCHWPDHYKSVFGFGKEDLCNYKQKVITDRFPHLRSAWEEANPVITACFGSSCWHYFEELLKPVGTYEKFDNYRIYENSGIVLTPFLNYRYMPHDLIKNVANRLRALWEMRYMPQ